MIEENQTSAISTNQNHADSIKNLSKLSPLILLFLFVPVVITSLLMQAYYLLPQLKEIIEPRHTSWLLYAFANWIVLLILFLLLKHFKSTKAVFIFKFPSSKEWLFAVIAFVIGAILIWPLITALNNILGTPIKSMDFQLNSFKSIILVTFFAVVTAPFVEEVLYRGLGIGYLISRGLPAWFAGAITIILFSIIHFPYFGIGGAIFIIFWGILPTTLRIYTKNLTSGLIMHIINNIWAYIIVTLLFR